jgi:hypothetical protein
VLQTTAGKMIFCRWSESGFVPDENGRREARPIHTGPHDRRGEDRGHREYRGAERRAEPHDRWASHERPSSAPAPAHPEAPSTSGGHGSTQPAHGNHPAEGGGESHLPSTETGGSTQKAG